jgi:hypothetical protein
LNDLKDGTNHVVSYSGVVVWKSPQEHPMLCHTDINHPDFQRKAVETYQRGQVRGLPRICSENSEDARTWFLFSPLLENSKQRELVLAKLLSQAFSGEIDAASYEKLDTAHLHFWHGKETPTRQLVPPPSLPFKQGLTEVDLIVTVEKQMLVFIEAKYHSRISYGVTHASGWDQVIRNIDVGSWFARGRFAQFYFILLQYGDYATNAESVVFRYKDKPFALRKALEHRTNLDDKQIEMLSRSIAFVRWPDPIK